MSGDGRPASLERPVEIDLAGVAVDGDLTVPAGAGGIVVFAHGSGSSRSSPRNRQVAQALQQAGLGTLLIDLLTADEEAVDRQTRALRFDIGLLAVRLAGALAWVARHDATAGLGACLFGASTGAAAALVAAARHPDDVRAVVSRGGRPDLAGAALKRVRAPTLLIVGGDDRQVLDLNRAAMRDLAAPHELQVVPGATHLFEEPGTLDMVAALAARWFTRHI
ncbi:MAG: dienelactone hydrolase family protein [Egibacteraceae bacterium]